jgi:hypothetical protein
MVVPFASAASRRALIDGEDDPGKDRPAIALVPNRPGKGLWRELLSSADTIPLFQ